MALKTLKKALGLLPPKKEKAQQLEVKETLNHLVGVLTLADRDLKNFIEIIDNDCVAGILDPEDSHGIHNQSDRDIIKVSEYAEEAMLRSEMPYPLSLSEIERYFQISLRLLGIYQSVFQYVTYIDLGIEYNPVSDKDEQYADLFWRDDNKIKN